jgi:uncharacterized protein (TIGR02246 family)
MAFWRQCACVVAIGMAMCAAGGQAQDLGVPEKDATEIRAALQGMQDAWNRHDMKAFVGYMTEDVEWVNVRGSWWRGKDEVYKQHQWLHETIFKTRQLHDPEKLELRSVAPGVVIATSMMMADAFTTPDGHAEPASLNALTEVFVRRDGRWLVANGHNTVVVPPGPPRGTGKP